MAKSEIGIDILSTQPEWSDDKVLVIISRGDKTSCKNLMKPRHLEIVSYIDPRYGYLPVLGEYGARAYLYSMIPRSFMPSLLTMAADTKTRIGTTIRNIIDEKILPQSVIDKLLTGEPLNVVELSELKFKTTELGLPHIKDLHLHTAGTKTFGSGGDFVDLATVSADADEQTGNIIHNMISNVTDTATPYAPRNDDELNGFSRSINLGGFVLTAEYNGDFYSLSMAAGATDSGTMEIYNGTIKRGATTTLTSNRDLITSGGTATWTAKIHHLTLDGSDKSYSRGITPNAANGTFKIYRCILKNMEVAGILVGTNAANNYENNVFDNCVNGVNNNSKTVTWRSCLFVNNGTANIQNATNSTSLNCGTDKAAVGAATDTAPAVNLTNANEFDATYKDLATGTIAKLGVAPALTTDNTTDYWNRTVVAPYEIGVGRQEFGGGAYCASSIIYDDEDSLSL